MLPSPSQHGSLLCKHVGTTERSAHAGASVSWDDIAGQDAAKRLIQEVIVWPAMNPSIFKARSLPRPGLKSSRRPASDMQSAWHRQ